MWQRKQTIYLALIVILMIGLCFLADMREWITAIVISACSVDALLAFKDRKKQMRKCRVGEMLSVLCIAYFAFEHWYAAGGVEPIPFYPCLYVVSLILFEMAYRGVKHDDDLVRSADRIR